MEATLPRRLGTAQLVGLCRALSRSSSDSSLRESWASEIDIPEEEQELRMCVSPQLAFIFSLITSRHTCTIGRY